MMARLRRILVDELPLPQQPQREPCCLYVIQEGGSDAYKIGIAAHPTRRLSDLRAGNRRRLSIQAVYAGSKVTCLLVEKAAHRFFKAAPGGEWVIAESAELITNFLDSLCDGGGIDGH